MILNRIWIEVHEANDQQRSEIVEEKKKKKKKRRRSKQYADQTVEQTVYEKDGQP